MTGIPLSLHDPCHSTNLTASHPYSSCNPTPPLSTISTLLEFELISRLSSVVNTSGAVRSAQVWPVWLPSHPAMHTYSLAQSQRQSPSPSDTQIAPVPVSQPWLPSVHLWSVGMAVGENVGVSVGDDVIVHVWLVWLSSHPAVHTYPTSHSHLHPPPEEPFPPYPSSLSTTQIPPGPASQPWLPSSH